MKARLLSYLACPACYGDLYLTVTEQHQEEILTGQLTCSQCQTTYPISGGIPRFVKQLTEDKHKTSEAFGYQWTHFTAMYETYEAQFLDWIYPLSRDFFKGKVVLDAGCGIGRHVHYAARFGAKEVIGVDLSAAVETCYANVASVEAATHVVQADIYHLPFRPGTFDFAFSIGVLHHLPDPEAGFRAVAQTVKPGEPVFAWVYGYENNKIVHYFIDPLRKNLTSRIPLRALRIVAFLMTLMIQVMVKGIYRPLNKMGVRVLPYNDYLYHLSAFSFAKNQMIVFDHLVAPTAFYIRREEFEGWFTALHLENIEISWRNKNSWRGRGTIPLTGQPSLKFEKETLHAGGAA